MTSISNSDCKSAYESMSTPDYYSPEQMLQLTPLGEMIVLDETRSTLHAQNVRDHSMCMFGTCQKSLPSLFAYKDIACCYKHYKCAIYRMRHNMCCICGTQCDGDDDTEQIHVCYKENCQSLARVKSTKFHETRSLFIYE
jgi:hypothetical protein